MYCVHTTLHSLKGFLDVEANVKILTEGQTDIYTQAKNSTTETVTIFYICNFHGLEYIT